MNFSSVFIRRPIFATVLSVIITLIGLMAARSLPIEQYPQVVPPSVSISATYPGADAQTVSDTVAATLSEEVNGVDDMIYLTSTSSDAGTMSMQVYFAIGTDPQVATINVNNRVQRAMSQLPSEVQAQGVTVEQRSNSVLLFIAMTSESGEYDSLFLNNYTNLNVIDELNQLPGVGQAQVLGNQEFAMRVWLDPEKLSLYDLTPAEVTSAIRAQNSVVAAGKLGAEPQSDPTPYTYTLTSQGRFEGVDEFRNILLRTDDEGASLRLSDVARVELGQNSYGVQGYVNNAPIAPVAIYLQPGANALEVAAEVKQAMQDLKERFPAGLDYVIPYDTTLFIDASIQAVEHTFIEALLLVAVIVFLFLQSWRSTLVAMSVVPISVIGTFAGMYLLDFSINLLSLFGMILAIGIVVDDAIVVIENIERILDEDENATPLQAAFEAMREVSGAVIATSLIMAAVFIPVGFMGGLTGQMYQQFAITIAMSVAISAIVALSFTPAISAIFLKNKSRMHQSRVVRAIKKPFDWFNKGFEKVTDFFMAVTNFLIRHLMIMLVLFVATCVASWWVYERLPGGLIPATDQGVAIASINLPAGASLARTDEYVHELTELIQAEIPAVEYVTGIAGFDLLSGAANTAKATMFITMKPWEQRDISVDDLTGKIMQLGAQVPGGKAMAFNVPPIQGLSPTGGFTGYLQSFGGDSPQELYQASLKVMQAANQRPELAQVFTTLNVSVPTYRLTVDEDKARSLGVSISDLNTTLSSTFGNAFVNYFTRFSRNFQVYVQSEDEFRRSPDDLANVYVRGGDGQRIPLSALVSIERDHAPSVLNRYNVYPAAQFQGSPAPGYSSGQAVEAMQEVVQETLGGQYAMGWTGEAYQQLNVGTAATLALTFGIVMMFLILAAQYESWTLPLAVVTATPFAFLGAILAVFLRDMSTSVYLQIGLLVVVGLAAKNAILIVEFAEQQRAQAGKSIIEAAQIAARQRFRPIVMTSLAFIGGTLPLALATGASAASRNQIGTPVVGGMITITVLASVFVPAAYVLIMQVQGWLSAKLGGDKRRREDGRDESEPQQSAG
ncbi:HAE1 family hydrophobic/amphiphilic exporter-1/multidrug efflux pump [Modicisalibacter xianhensis]|uniref:Efflux pump membrane transporter n=1 Tax=Modicisalibacter xianhensis TaxID=442341 RepID=A0A4R8FIU0_9GAMM|nr:multidrug efflux RND transporter permease subunit [Halomonas xianhensis]TDX23798.1 HAE1 family hydrophobic/amphiphilic exporter-1/multidrug efflux pump [Halomonas xianhensis]